MTIFSRLAKVATRLIEKYGEEAELSRNSRTPDDSQQPWRGSTTLETLSVTAVSPELISGDTDTLKTRESIVYISGEELNVSLFDFITLAGNRYRIIRSNEIGTPSDISLYELTVKA